VAASLGGSDGGVHVVDLQQLLAATRQGVSPATAAAVALTSLPGHLAAVLDLDYCPARRQLVSASEVRSNIQSVEFVVPEARAQSTAAGSQVAARLK
jgi:hypothetical protein